MPSLFSVDDVARRLAMHPKTIRRYIREGRLTARRIGKEYRITSADLDAFAGAVPSEPPVERKRHVIASTIVDIDAISPDESQRITTMLLAGMNARKGEDDYPRIDGIYFRERGALRITITANPALTASLLRVINALLEDGRDANL